MAEAERISGAAVVQDGYLFLCGFSGVGLLPFIMREVVRPGSVGKTIIGAILTVGGILAGVLVLLPAVFGWNRLLTEEYPILPLLAGAALPGNILARGYIRFSGSIPAHPFNARTKTAKATIVVFLVFLFRPQKRSSTCINKSPGTNIWIWDICRC